MANFSNRMAPSPRKGNARIVFRAIRAWGEPIMESDLHDLVRGDIKSGKNTSEHTTFKRLLIYLANNGYVTYDKQGKGRWYRVATLEHFEARQNAKVHRQIAKPEEVVKQERANDVFKAYVTGVAIGFMLPFVSGAIVWLVQLLVK